MNGDGCLPLGEVAKEQGYEARAFTSGRIGAKKALIRVVVGATINWSA